MAWLLRLSMPWRTGATSRAPFQLATRHEALARAWRRVRRNGGGAGGDGITILAFAADAPHQLKRLREQLVEGRYRPGPLRRVEIPKADGGTRTLAIPCVADRVVQAAAAAVLDSLLDSGMAGSSFAYRGGRSVRQAVQCVRRHREAGFGWVVDADIERFFDNVQHDRLLALLRERIDDDRLTALVRIWLHGFDRRGRGLAQGSPISPLLANLYLDPIDKQIEAPAARLVRYADDFLILCPDRRTAERARQRTAVLLHQHGLRLHPAKTRVTSFADGFAGRFSSPERPQDVAAKLIAAHTM